MKKKVLLGFLFALVVVGFLATTLRNPLRKEPEHNGRTVSQWSEQWWSNRFKIHSGGQDAKAAAEEAQNAIREVGTNGIPFFLELLRVKEAPLVAKIKKVVPRSWRVRLNLNASSMNAMELNRHGAHGIAALGTNAATAIPTLIELVESPASNPDLLCTIIWALKFLGPEAEPAIPSLIKSLGSGHHSSVRGEAVATLGFINRAPELVVPALIEFLDWRTREGSGNGESINALDSLANLGTNASAATPAVEEFLHDPDRWTREAATNCIRRIDPAAALRAGITP